MRLVGETGFEPATLCSQSRCATRLRYSPFRAFYGLRLNGAMPKAATGVSDVQILRNAATAPIFQVIMADYEVRRLANCVLQHLRRQ